MEPHNQDEMEAMYLEMGLPPRNSFHNYAQVPLKFGMYKLVVGISTGIERTAVVDVSDYFSRNQWDGLEPCDQHNWLDDHVLEWSEKYLDMGWELVCY